MFAGEGPAAVLGLARVGLSLPAGRSPEVLRDSRAACCDESGTAGCPAESTSVGCLAESATAGCLDESAPTGDRETAAVLAGENDSDAEATAKAVLAAEAACWRA